MPRLTRPPLRVLLDLVLWVVVAAVALWAYTRFSPLQLLGRDPSIYVYAGQRLVHGVPPYASIVDPKNPGTTLICGAAIAVGRALVLGDVQVVRDVFLGIAVLTAIAMYDLGRVLWSSALGGVVAAAVFISFRAWAMDAWTGPDALMPGILFAVLALSLAIRRRWSWAGFAASLAFVVWQPLVGFVVVVLVAGVILESGRRLRTVVSALVGAAIPVAAVAIYFAAVGVVGEWAAAAFLQPAGIDTWVGFTGGVRRITSTVASSLGDLGGWLFWVGTALVVLLAAVRPLLAERFVLARPCERPSGARAGRWRDPLWAVVLISAVLMWVFALIDFLHYPHLYPLLPYPPLGLSGAVVLVQRLTRRSGWPARAWQVATGTVAAGAAAALCAFSITVFAHQPTTNHLLTAQRAEACVLQKVLGRHGRLWAVDDPAPLVLTNRVNPDRYVYLDAGVLEWKLQHLRGGFIGWERQIARADPTVIDIWTTFDNPLRPRLTTWLHTRYRAAWIGDWRVYVLRPVAYPLLRPGVSPVACGTTYFGRSKSAGADSVPFARAARGGA